MVKELGNTPTPKAAISEFFKGVREDTGNTLFWELVTKPALLLLWVVLSLFLPFNRFWSRIIACISRSQGGRNWLAGLGLVKSDRPETIVFAGHQYVQMQSTENRIYRTYSRVGDLVYILLPILTLILVCPLIGFNLRSAVQTPIATAIPATRLSSATPTIISTASPTQTAFSTEQPGSERNIENEMFMLVAAEVMGFGLLALFAFLATKLAIYQTRIYDVNIARINLKAITPALLRAGLPVLILLLLPYPAGEILLPLLIPFILVALFDIVRYYPNLFFKSIVTRHYSTIIFLAEFGAWYAFLSMIRSYLNPFWRIYEDLWQYFIRQTFDHLTLRDAVISNPGLFSGFIQEVKSSWPSLLPQFWWDILPILLAVLLAIGPWRYIETLVKTHQIAKIEISTKSVENRRVYKRQNPIRRRKPKKR
jgi:hypothetical protein